MPAPFNHNQSEPNRLEKEGFTTNIPTVPVSLANLFSCALVCSRDGVLSAVTRASIAPCLVWSRHAAALSLSKLLPRHSAAPPRDADQPGTQHHDRHAVRDPRGRDARAP